MDHTVVRSTGHFDPTIHNPLWISMVYLIFLQLMVFFSFCVQRDGCEFGRKNGRQRGRRETVALRTSGQRRPKRRRLSHPLSGVQHDRTMMTTDSPLLINQKEKKKKEQLEKI